MGNSINQNRDTFLDAPAALSKIQDMQAQFEEVEKTLGSTREIMDVLGQNFTGVSSSTLKRKYMEVEETFFDFHNYLQEQANRMQTLTQNIQNVDEG